jgi:hypothetical protein
VFRSIRRWQVDQQRGAGYVRSLALEGGLAGGTTKMYVQTNRQNNE